MPGCDVQLRKLMFLQTTDIVLYVFCATRAISPSCYISNTHILLCMSYGQQGCRTAAQIYVSAFINYRIVLARGHERFNTCKCGTAGYFYIILDISGDFPAVFFKETWGHIQPSLWRPKQLFETKPSNLQNLTKWVLCTNLTRACDECCDTRVIGNCKM